MIGADVNSPSCTQRPNEDINLHSIDLFSLANCSNKSAVIARFQVRYGLDMMFSAYRLTYTRQHLSKDQKS